MIKKYKRMNIGNKIITSKKKRKKQTKNLCETVFLSVRHLTLQWAIY